MLSTSQNHERVTALYREPFKLGTPHHVTVPAGTSIAAIVRRMQPSLPADFQARGSVLINGHMVPSELWGRVYPKPGKSIVTLHQPVQGGGGGGGGGKQVLAIVAAIALTVISAGIAAYGIPLLGVQAGTLTSTLLAAGVSMVGALVVGALTSVPTASAQGDDRQNGGRSLQPASLNGNMLEPNAPFPAVIGSRRIFPPLVFEPYIELVGQNEFIHALYALAGPHLIEDIRLGDAAIEELFDDADVSIEVDDGTPGGHRIVVPPRYSRSFSVNVEMSTHGTDVNNLIVFNGVLPVWHPTISADNPHEIWLHFLCSGMLTQDDPDEIVRVPFRIRLRRRGDTEWRYCPEFHYMDNTQSQRRMQVKFLFGQTFTSTPITPAAFGFTMARKVVPGQNVDPVGADWEADAYFSSGAGNDVYDATTVGSTNVINTNMSADTVTFYLDSAEWLPGIYEIEVIRGAAFLDGDFTNSNYQLSGSVLDFFGARSSNVLPLTRAGLLDRMQFLRAVSIRNEPPLNVRNLALIKLTARNRAINNLSVRASRYVMDWNDHQPKRMTPEHVLYVRFDGENGATAAVDEARAHPITFHGDAELDTSVKMIGNASLRMNGTGYVQMPDSDDFHLPGDFTIHGWLQPETIVNFPLVLLKSDFVTDKSFFLCFGNDGGGNINNIIFNVSFDGTNDAVFLVSPNDAIPTEGASFRMFHLEISREGDVWRMFVDGILISSATVAGSMFNNTTDMIVGGFNGWLDQLEIVKGRALHSSNFIPPGAGDAWDYFAPTSNPAPHYRDILTGSSNFDPLPLELLNETELLAWRERCKPENDDLRCDLVVEAATVSEALRIVASCGYASPYQSELWGVVQDYDRTAEAPVQIFTPRNMNNFRWQKAFPRLPTGLRVNFRDDEHEYTGRQIVVYRAGNDETDARTEQVTYDGLVRRADVIKRARFDLMQGEHRSVIYSFTAPVEAIVCRRGSLVGVQHDILQKHYGYARIVEIVRNSANEVTEIVLDSDVEVFDEIDMLGITDMLAVPDMLTVGLITGIAVRQANGDVSVHRVSGPSAQNTDRVTLDDPIENDHIVTGNLVVIGIHGEEYKRLLVSEITPGQNLTANLVLVDEAPQIWS